MSNTILEISKQIKAKLSNLYASNEIDSFIFMIYDEVASLTSAQILAYPEKELDIDSIQAIELITERLLKHEPIQYILGYSEFYDCKLNVQKGVLIPRPETEELVHWILHDFNQDEIQVIDVGTGSGAIPIALASNRPKWKIHGIDISADALKIAKQNAKQNAVAVDFHLTDVLNQELPQENSYNVIVSNPPYVTNKEKDLMQANVLDFEPHLALFVDDDSPLIFYKRIAELAMDRLVDDGCLYLEINEQFGNETSFMLKKMGFINIQVRKDLNGKDRMVKAHK
jgi:release factor glutamine methyltransferase